MKAAGTVIYRRPSKRAQVSQALQVLMPHHTAPVPASSGRGGPQDEPQHGELPHPRLEQRPKTGDHLLGAGAYELFRGAQEGLKGSSRGGRRAD